MAQTRAKTGSARARRGVRSLAVCSQLSLLGGKNGKAVKNSSRGHKKSVPLWTEKREEHNASNGMVCCCQQVSMYEMWKRQQIHENARTMYRAEVLVK